MSDYRCDCGCEKADHQGGTYWCRTSGCSCLRYTPDIQQAARDHAEGESTSARLRRVEQERDELAVRLHQMEMSEAGEIVAATVRLSIAQAELATAVERHRTIYRAQNDHHLHLQQRLTAVKAELVSAKAELELLRATRQEATDA